MESKKPLIAEEIEEVNQVLIKAQELAKLGNWETNIETGEVQWSPMVYEIYECDPEKYTPNKNSFKDFTHPDDKSTVLEEDSKALSTGTLKVSHRIITAKGNIKYVQEIASEVSEAPGRVFRGTIQDITQLRETEKALTNEKKRLDIIISSSNLGTYDWDRKKELYSYNEYYANILGYSKDEFTVLRFEEWAKFVHPDDLLAMQNYFIENHRQAVIKYEFEIRLRHKDGHWVWVLNNGQVENLNEDLVPSEHSGIIIDISERKKAQIELDRTKAQLQQTNKITKTGGWTWDFETSAISWTENTRRIYEVGDDYEPNFNTIFEFLYDKNEEAELKQLIETSIKNKKGFDIELHLLSAQGRDFWVRTIAVPVIKDGNVTRFYGTVQNIDSIKKNQLELEEKTKQYNELVENIPIGVYKLNRNGDLNYMSPPFRSITGIGDKDIDTSDFANDIVHPDDLQLFMEANSYALENYKYFNLEFRIRADEKVKWVKATSQPNKDNDGNWYWFGTLSDITYRKKAELHIQKNEKQLQNIISSMTEALLFYDEKGIIKSANDSTVDIVKIPKNDILGSHLMPKVLSLVDGDGKVLTAKEHPVAVALREKKSFNDIKIQLVNLETRRAIWIEANIKIIEEQDTHWALVTFNDISERVKSEKQLLEAKKAAESSNRAKSSFLANMSHEIRTPLNGVIGFSDLLRKTNLNSLQADYTKHIYNSAHSLLGIINDILDFSKIEAGKLNLQVEEVNGLKLVESAAAFITYQISQKGLEMVIDYEKDVPMFFKGDELRLSQILINLLGNAVKFTEKGTILLKVSKKDNKTIRFEVIDTGIGISQKQQKNIFSAFEQADVSTTRKFGGSGLGLTISNKLLKMMGSKLKLKSEPKQGSNFYFDIQPQGKLQTSKKLLDSKKLSKIHKALLVDDNYILNQSLKDLLSNFDINVQTKSSAIEAHKILKEGELFDLIIIDEEMDNINGIELLDMLKEKKLIEGTPIIILHKHIESNFFLSTHASDDRIYKVPKPVVNSQLIKTIENIDKGNKIEGMEKREDYSKKFTDISAKIDKILIAEDNEVNKFLISRILENVLPDSEIIHAENGEIAVEKFKKDRPDLILMDIQMPIMSGLEATEIIRAYEKQGTRVPILALSAGVLKEEKEKALNVGIDDFLEKPLIQEDLISALRKLKFEEQHNITNTKTLKEEHQKFNKKDLLNRLNNNKEHYISFINLAKENMLTFERQLNEIIEIENIQALRNLLHKLKGTALAACFENLADLINKFERPSFYNQKVTLYMKSKIIPELHKLIDILDSEVKDR